MTRHRPSRRAAQLVMWLGIAASAVLLLALLARGWGDEAWAVAGAVLFLACVATCIWAGRIGERSSREVQQAVDRLGSARRDQQRRSR